MEKQILNNLIKDLKKARTELTDKEARYFVDLYYQVQEFRKAIDNQIRSIVEPVYYDEDGKKRKPTEEEKESYVPEPHDNLNVLSDIIHTFETRIKVMLDVYTNNHIVGRWAKSICGIGPVIAAGLLAHIDIEKAPTAGHIWSYAGLNPQQKWAKGQKRPWNASLKVLCWKIGDSFKKQKSRENDIYGKILDERKTYEQQRNENGEYAEQAKSILQKKNIGKSTDAYKWYSQGMLPPAHIQQRAERYATKIFLSHLHTFWYTYHYQTRPPKPFAISILGHAHEIEPPNMHMLAE
ncbi:MAG: transposase [Deltaproteobacteria bacterium]|nr:transposase [Deltaproteobacteria bacterium]